jgi:hypothetical protein
MAPTAFTTRRSVALWAGPPCFRRVTSDRISGASSAFECANRLGEIDGADRDRDRDRDRDHDRDHLREPLLRTESSRHAVERGIAVQPVAHVPLRRSGYKHLSFDARARDNG